MARTKQTNPLRRNPSSTEVYRRNDPNHSSFGDLHNASYAYTNGKGEEERSSTEDQGASLGELFICIAGIYASFLSWAVLQERITTTPHGRPRSSEVFRYPIFLNTVQSIFAGLTGFIYHRATSRSSSVLPTSKLLIPLLLVAITSSLASPFGYASLKHIDYITFILAKSCKLLPVMFLQLTLFRKSYPLYKYAVIALVTAGVAVFTLHNPSNSRKGKGREGGSSAWGLMLLGINLLFDGLTNSTQDYIFKNFKNFSGPQMMCAQNLFNTALTVSYMILSPYLGRAGVGEYLGIDLGTRGDGEFGQALAFLRRNPAIGKEILGFAICGAFGQVFIFYTLSKFSSLLLVTVTVTRKMLTMIISVVWFGHTLSGVQWVGVGLVFGGVGAEGVIQRREKTAKAKAKEGFKKD